MEAKKDIRKNVLAKRNHLTKAEWEIKSNEICEKTIQNHYFQNAKEIYCYMDFRMEVGTKKIIEKAWELNKRVAIPKTDDNSMRFYYISSWDDVSSGRWGILEPLTDELAEGSDVCVIMPGAVFDTNRNRIGYGKGYYDTFLNNQPAYKTIALAFELQIEKSIPSEPHDIRPQMIITEEQIYV